jgi:hypothetical protein
MSDDVPTAPEQNRCAADPKHWNKNRRHMSFLWMLTMEKFRPAKGRSGVRNAALNKNLREPRNQLCYGNRAMSRYKGRTNTEAIEQAYPHIVEMIVPLAASVRR